MRLKLLLVLAAVLLLLSTQYAFGAVTRGIVRTEGGGCMGAQFMMEPEEGYHGCRMMSSTMDLSQFVDMKCEVEGEEIGCSMCSMLDVRSVRVLSIAPVKEGTWGRIKALYR